MYAIIKEIDELSEEELIESIKDNAEYIVSQTPGDVDDWDDPEEWQMSAVELAHSVYKLCKLGVL